MMKGGFPNGMEASGKSDAASAAYCRAEKFNNDMIMRLPQEGSNK